jgi:alpha-glucosidase
MTSEGYSDLFERIRFQGDPVASPDSTVVSGHARFTILTPRLIRLEWSETGVFEDRSTYAFPTRYTSTPPRIFQRLEGKTLVIDTGPLQLRYTQSSGRFSADNLSIFFDLGGERRTWTPGMSNPANLRGTRRTLDECDGDAGLEEGILSRAGWAVFDDSRSVVFNPHDGWVAPRPDHELQDWYFFGYGHDYKAALTEYTRFGGRIPLIPRFALGGWWSRYWVYSDQDLKDLVGEFETHDIPLDVLVVDIDWHTPDSWTGYTWNRELFPDPPAFIRWVHDKGLRTSLNLHPAEGVQAFEEVYPRFAEAMGVDPASGQAIPFRIADKRYVQNYFELIHHPMEDDGIDFWWIDWQQGKSTEVKGLDPLPWLNHLHFCDLARHERRSLLFSRWGGLGNHRYQIGFSGDTYAEWAALQFQPYFTATAANVLYGWWSHDIGGHMGGATEPELYARWVQFGALSPCLRLHATKDPLAERRPWKYPPEVYRAAKAAFHWRYRLVPYIYTMARVAYDTGISLCRPMYYEFPGQDAAYVARYQYFFGDQMIAAPIVHPADPETGMAPVTIWVPEGTWIDHTTRETFTGPCWVRLVGDLDRVPMLVKAGAILPLAPSFRVMSPPHMASGTTGGIPRDRLVLSVFPEGDGVFRLYEDDGTTKTYTEGQAEWTEIRTHIRGEDTWVVHIAPVEGHCEMLPAQRQVELRLEGSRRPRQVTVNGAEVTDWTYDSAGLTTIINVPGQDKRQPAEIVAIAEGPISALGEPHNRGVILSDVRRLLGDAWPAPADETDMEGLFKAVLDTASPGRAEAIARLGGPLVHFIEYVTPEESGQQLGGVIVGAPSQGERSYDLEATFTRFHEGRSERHTVRIAGAEESHILDLPWAFNRQVRAGRWEAEVRITWRGEKLVYSHQSKPLFPTIYVWRSLVYDEDKEPVLLEQVMDQAGKIKEGLDWQLWVQNPARVRNINQPHAVLFFKEYQQELRAGLPLAAFLSTTVISPDERDVIVWYRSSGLAELYLNGQRVEKAPEVGESGDLPSFFCPLRETEVVRLRGGKNSLVVHARPALPEGLYWFFGGAFATPDGDVMLDLLFE